VANRDKTIWAFVAIGSVVVIAHALLGITIGEGYAIPTTIVGAAAAAFILKGPVGHALARRIQGAEPSELPPEQVLAELDELRTRVAELEERADFSERLLARHRTGDQGEA